MQVLKMQVLSFAARIITKSKRFEHITPILKQQQNRLQEHLCKTAYGSSAFINAAPLLWNRLPLDIKNSLCISAFKNKLKSHLFVRYYQ